METKGLKIFNYTMKKIAQSYNTNIRKLSQSNKAKGNKRKELYGYIRVQF